MESFYSTSYSQYMSFYSCSFICHIIHTVCSFRDMLIFLYRQTNKPYTQSITEMLDLFIFLYSRSGQAAFGQWKLRNFYFGKYSRAFLCKYYPWNNVLFAKLKTKVIPIFHQESSFTSASHASNNIVK